LPLLVHFSLVSLPLAHIWRDAVYATFAGVFLDILKKTILTWLCEPYWFGALWFFLCGIPAMLQATKQILFVSNTTLYALNTAAIPSMKKHNEGGNISM
jgi:hypothetical protein